MIKRTGIAALVLAALFSVLGFAPAQAGNPIVTGWEFRHVTTGEPRAQVAQVFDTHGSRLAHGGSRYGELMWKVYPSLDGGAAIVTYLHPDGRGAWVLVDKKLCNRYAHCSES